MILEHKGINIFYTDEGKGEAIVLLHGFLENSSMWQYLIPDLVEKNRVITIDLLGHGQTGCLGYIHTMEMMAEAVNKVISFLKIDKSVFIGHSMGGYVALAFIELYPDKVNKLCLMNSTAIADSKEKQLNRDRAILAVKSNHKTFISMSIANLFRPKNRLVFKDEIKLIKEEALQMPLQGIIAALEGMKIRKNRELILQNRSLKKMMIIGSKDPVLEYNTLIKQTTGTDVKVVEFPDGHMSHIENKKELSYNINQFIEK